MSFDIKQSLLDVEKRIQKACEISGRPRDAVTLVAVTKTFSSGVIREAYAAGLRQFGENKIQELLSKKADMPADCRWHMIGRLQTNKVKAAVQEAVLIHSLDRMELFDKITEEARKQKRGRVECLLQINVSGEASKAGFGIEEAARFLKQYDGRGPVEICGLMTMAPFTDDFKLVRAVFKKTRELFAEWKVALPRHPWRHLSMGMSGDFEIAIEEGATIVRIGTALFGKRPEKGGNPV